MTCFQKVNVLGRYYRQKHGQKDIPYATDCHGTGISIYQVIMNDAGLSSDHSFDFFPSMVWMKYSINVRFEKKLLKRTL